MKRRYTEFSSILQKRRTLIVSFSNYNYFISLFLQFPNGASRAISQNLFVVSLLSLVAHIVLCGALRILRKSEYFFY